MASKDSTWQMRAVKPWILLALLLGCLLGSLVGCESTSATGTDGAALYQTYCATCHGPKGKPTEAMVARINVRDLTAHELRARITPALVETQIRTGSQNKLMPAFAGAISDEQMKAIAAYVASPAFLEQR
jgi:mono/diheme cytochrome c family protein